MPDISLCRDIFYLRCPLGMVLDVPSLFLESLEIALS